MEDCDGDGCGVCFEEIGVYFVWFWRLINSLYSFVGFLFMVFF